MRQIHQTVLDSVLALKPRPTQLLDIGCNDGAFTQILATSLPQTSVIAVDVKAPRKRFSRFEFIEASAEELPFEDNSFDSATAVLSMHHWTDKRKGIAEAYRVLRNGGHLIIGDPLLDGPLRSRPLGWLAQVTDGGTFATPGELRDYLASTGFSEPHIEVVPNSLNSLYLITTCKAI